MITVKINGNEIKKYEDRKKLEGSGIKIKTVMGLGYTIEDSEIIN